MEAIETNSFAGDLLDENCGRQNLDTGSNEVLGGLIVTEANDEPLDVVRSVAKEDNSMDDAKLAEETFQHHLFLVNIWQISWFKQNLIWHRGLQLEFAKINYNTNKTHLVQQSPGH